MTSSSLKYLAAITVTALGLTLSACQQAPPAASPAPTTTTIETPAPTTTESTTTKSTEVKPADPANPDAGAQKTTTESTTVKQKQQ
jgi:hypothetical protein